MQTVVISIDAELSWGFHDWAKPPRARIDAARQGWGQLLDLLETFQLPATWAVVGHLFLDDCDGRHAGHPAPAGWFEAERDRWRDRPEVRFGSDLLEELLSSPVAHEIACHSFSHVLFDESRTSRELARAELSACEQAARDWGISFDSFVFPRNHVGYRDLLAEAGYRCYRGRAPSATLDGRFGRPLSKLAQATLIESTPPVVSPTVDEYGLVNIPASLFLFAIDGLPRRVIEPIWGNPVVREVQRGVDAVIEEGGVFHVWLHPNNLTDEAQVRQLRACLEYIEEQVARTDLTVETMASVAETFQKDSADQPGREAAIDAPPRRVG